MKAFGPYKPEIESALVDPPKDARSARLRREPKRELERQINRALWRAESRSHKVPTHVRRGASYVHAQRRVIAREVVRALRSLGAGPELATSIAARACERFPRDGIVLAGNTPRERGEAPRQLGSNPRARGTSPRQRGTSPRQKRAAADLSNDAVASTVATGSDRNVDRAPTVATGASESVPPPPIEELAPGWAELKASITKDLTLEERARAAKAVRADAERLRKQRSRSNPPSPHD